MKTVQERKGISVQELVRFLERSNLDASAIPTLTRAYQDGSLNLNQIEDIVRNAKSMKELSLTEILKNAIKEYNLDHLEYKGEGKYKPQGEDWISTKESLPPYKQQVEVFNGFSNQYGKDYRDSKDNSRLWSTNFFKQGWTHWKPIK